MLVVAGRHRGADVDLWRYRNQTGHENGPDSASLALPSTVPSWSQPFRWGLLIAFDSEGQFELPDGIGSNAVRASSTCLTVPVLHAQDVEIPEDAGPNEPIPEAQVHVMVAFAKAAVDVEFESSLACPSGRLYIGDAENERVIDVPPGNLLVQVARAPIDFAEQVTLYLTPAG